MIKGLGYGIPKWLAVAVGVTWSKHLFNTLAGSDWPGFDHVRTYKRRVVISQPYEGNGQTCEILANLHRKGICARLWGMSPYFPGRTFSVVMWRPEDELLADEIMNLMHTDYPEMKPGQGW